MEVNGYGPARHAELAKLLKCSEASIRNYRIGRVPPRWPMVQKLRSLTGLSPEQLQDPFPKRVA